MWEACHQNSETSGFRQGQKRQLQYRPLHWKDLPQLPARTDTDSHAARQAAGLARIICAVLIVPIFVSQSPSTPPNLVCCEDRLNPPSMSQSNTPSASPRRASSLPWAAPITATTTLCLKQSMASTRPHWGVALRRIRYPDLGGLVQQATYHGAHRQHVAGRG